MCLAGEHRRERLAEEMDYQGSSKGLGDPALTQGIFCNVRGKAELLPLFWPVADCNEGFRVWLYRALLKRARQITCLFD